MLTPENILLLIFVGLLLMNIQTIVGAIALYFLKIKDVDIAIIDRESIPNEVIVMVQPYDDLLRSKGFVYRSAIEYNNMLEKFDILQHSFYYYHEEKGIHAFVETMPFQGALQSVALNYATFYESYHMAVTHDCFEYNLLPLESVSYFDHYHGSFENSFESHLQDRVMEGEVIRHEVLSKEGVSDYMRFQVDESLKVMIEEGIMTSNSDGLKFSLSFAYLKYIHRIVKGHKFASKVLASKLSDVRSQENRVENVFSFKNSEEIALSQQLEQKPKEADAKSKIKTFIISGVAFVLFFGLIGIPWTVLPMIVIVLLIHELGHFYAMKFFGYKDTSIFFIPFFGAAAKGEKEEVTPFEEYVVFLAGPLPGMLISIAIGVSMYFAPELRSNELLREFTLMLFALNYLNLLPIFPLDGGKIVQTLLFTRYPKAQFYFYLLSLFVIIIATLMLQSIILALFSVVLFFAINHNYYIATLIEKVLEQKSEQEIKERTIEILVHNKQYQKIPFARKGAMLKQALKILNTKKPKFLLTLFGIGFYLLFLLPPLWFYFKI